MKTIERKPPHVIIVAVFAAALLFVGDADAKGSGGHSGGDHSSGGHSRGLSSGSHAGGHSASHSGSHGSAGGSHAHSSTAHASSTVRSSAATTHTPTSTRAAQGVARDSHGKIARSEKAKDDFKHSHPCPSTGKQSGACPGYVIDHVQALKHGGADTPSNMQWQTVADAKAKDRTE
jgi:hypothetical protein